MNVGIGHNQDIPVKVIRTDRRKTATVKIVEGKVHVIVPKRLSNKRIEELIKQKSNWIRGKLHLQASMPPVRPKEFVSGEAFAYLGRNYRLKLLEGFSGDVKLKAGRSIGSIKAILPETRMY